MKIICTFLVLLSSLIAWGDGMILPSHNFISPSSVTPPSLRQVFEIKYHNVTAEITDQKAEVAIDQKFRNPQSYQIEAIYIFPLPNNAMINSLSVTMDDKIYDAKLMNAKEAKEIYESYVRKQKDPALLEYIGNGLYKTRVFPFAAKKDLGVQVGYQELLSRKGNTVKWLYPLNTEKFSSTPLEKVSVTATIKSKHAIGSVYSPTHDLKITRVNKHEVRCEYADKNVKPSEDLIIYYTISETDKLDYMLLSSLDKNNAKEGFFLLQVNPNLWAQKNKIPYVPKDIFFVLDRSGSMSGKKIEQAKNALKFVLKNLNQNDSFSILAYDDQLVDFQNEHIKATSDNISKGLEFADNIHSSGGTDINGALLHTLKRIKNIDNKQPKYIIFLTDGQPTSGETNIDKIIKNTISKLPEKTRIFSFGVGNGVNTKLLDKISMEANGLPFYVNTSEDIEKSVSELYSSIQNPVLTDIEISFSGQKITYAYPTRLPDLFRNSQLLMVGKYSPGGKCTMTIKGTFLDQPKTMTYEVELNKKVTDNYMFVGRLWAQRRIGTLTDLIRKNGDKKELVEEVTKLATRFGIVTEHTSFLITEETKSRHEVKKIMKEKSSLFALGSSMGSKAVHRSKNVQRQQKSSNMADNAYYNNADGVKVDVSQKVQFVDGRAFYLRKGNQWVDSKYDKSQSLQKVVLNSDQYFKLISANKSNNAIMSLGQNVIFVSNNQAYEIVEK